MIGIVTAMKIEAEPFLRNGYDKKEVFFGKEFYTIKGLDAVLTVCGIGKVNASFSTALLIDKYNPDVILNCGVSGGLGCGESRLDVLDIVVAKACVQHDVDTSPIGDPKGMVSTVNVIYFPTDEELSKKLVTEDVKSGVVACGEQFVASKEKKEEIIREFGAIACDMESGAVAQCAYLAEKKFVCVRCVSDSGDGRAPEDYGRFCKDAAEKTYRAVSSLFA